MPKAHFSDHVRIDILICTYRRPALARTLRSVDEQVLPDNFVTRIVVADNDDTPSAQGLSSEMARTMKTPVHYRHAPARNISVARNSCLDAADADWVAFIDDDEVAEPTWIAALHRRACDGGFDAVFGPALAEYDDETPRWIRLRDYHSTWPQMRSGVVQTGHAGNVLLRWKGAFYQRERFLLEKGQSGGEDTEFFFRLWRRGARFGIANDGAVREPVDPARLSFGWIGKRKFRAGQSYGHHAIVPGVAERAILATAAAAKVSSCAAMTLLTSLSETRRRYWALRGIFHAGVFAAQFGVKEPPLYGD